MQNSAGGGEIDSSRSAKAIFTELQEALGAKLPKTCSTHTPSGGAHVFYKLPEGTEDTYSKSCIINTKIGKPIAGLEIKGVGSYVVGPGSHTIDQIKDGKQKQWAGVYHWATGCSPADIPIAIAPQALIDLAGRAGEAKPRRGNEVACELDTPEAIARAIKYLKDKAPKGEAGSLRQTILSIANRLGDFGLSAETSAELVTEHWEPDKCDGPTESEGSKSVLGRCLGAYATRNAPVGCDYRPSWRPLLEAFDDESGTDDDWRGDSLGSGRRDENKPQSEPKKRKLKRINFADCSKAALVKGKNALIENVIGRAQTSCWYGPPGCGKTNILLEVGCAVARGAPWAGRKTKQGLVVYVACEGADIIIKRLAAISSALPRFAKMSLTEKKFRSY